jgi:hypothetical protein
LLLVTVRLYVPGAKPDGNVAFTLLLLNELTASVEVAKTTVGARSAGLKSCPVIVICCFAELTTVLKIFGVAASARMASAVRQRIASGMARYRLSMGCPPTLRSAGYNQYV